MQCFELSLCLSGITMIRPSTNAISFTELDYVVAFSTQEKKLMQSAYNLPSFTEIPQNFLEDL